MHAPAVIDVVFAFLLLVVASIFEYVYFWPRFRADTAADRPGARTRGYRRGVMGQWGFALGALGIWRLLSRPWSALGFTMPQGWRAVSPPQSCSRQHRSSRCSSGPCATPRCATCRRAAPGRRRCFHVAANATETSWFLVFPRRRASVRNCSIAAISLGSSRRGLVPLAP